MVEVTLALLKPDALAAGYQEAILARIHAEGFTIVKQEQRQLTMVEARRFYEEHADEVWYEELAAFMCSGPLLALLLQREDAISYWRKLIGHRWPPIARTLDPHCLRAMYGSERLGANAVHGSDNAAAVAREMRLLGWTP